ncbi:plexin-A4-like [Actinia tenebrosa]|uniref:Plexin-A4-like n=1 Tax=Actinia tenebrosa TaxID=6105 RepID=A0A6P8IDP2_ACTTE|nr:plexin-A4-like [Actinia tenebrosa]
MTVMAKNRPEKIFCSIVLTLCLWNICYAYTELPTPGVLTNIIVDNVTGNIYIGGSNFLLKASSDLDILRQNSTGPKPDNPLCTPPPHSCKETRVPTDNHNKILLIDESQRKLLTCGSLYHGYCEVRDLNDLDITVPVSKPFVASGHPNAAVGFIAPGPSELGGNVLYIGTTWFPKIVETYTDIFAVSSRSIDSSGNLFELALDGGKVTALKFSDYNYEVRYVYGFSHSDFSYFITVQESLASYKKRASNPSAIKEYETKIVSLCQKDSNYQSYTEIPLKCLSRSGVNFNIATSAVIAKGGDKLTKKSGIPLNSEVLFITFSKSNPGSSEPTQSSVLCYYSMKEIKEGFNANIQKCSETTGMPLGVPWTAIGKGTCVSQKYSGTCPSNTNNHPLGGSISVSTTAILEKNQSTLLSISALPYEDYTVVFLGDNNGHLLKVSVGDSSSLLTPYHDEAISQGKPLTKVVLSKDRQSLYVANDLKVFKVPVEDCSSHSSCKSCTGHGDPFCGWCTLYEKCSRRALCANSAVHPLRFTTNASQCIQFVSTKPERFPYGSVTQFDATIKSMPPLLAGETYKCYINSKERPAVVFSNGTIQCSTPPKSDLPPITSDTGDVLVDLSLISSETGKTILSTKIPFYDCTLMKRCVLCSESNYDCDWCIYKGKCYADGNTQCPGEIILSSQKRTPGAVGCPRLAENQTFLLPNKISTSMKIQAKNLPAIKYNFQYECNVMVEGKNFRVGALRDSDSQVTCQESAYSYSKTSQYSPAELKVLWRGEDEIHKPDSIKVSLYKCDVNRDDCSTCLVADGQLNCGWCKLTSSCQVEKGCDQKWVHRSQPCYTKPVIKKFWPMSGPPRGNTEIEITGVDFGKVFGDIKDSVFIGNYSCIPDPRKYVVSKRITCNTTKSNEEVKGPVIVVVNGIRGSSRDLFSYQTPVVKDFNPKKGPESGGSLINITGINLNTGRRIEAWLGKTPCVIDRLKVTDTSIPCITQAVSTRMRRAVSNESTSHDVVVSFDGFFPPSPPGKFEFKADPVYAGINPDRTFPSGGLKLTVTGENFDSVRIPKIYFTNADDKSSVSKEEICDVKSSKTMVCPSPNITIFNIEPGSKNGSELIVGLVMDNVPGLENVTTLALVMDPYFTPFDGVEEINSESLILKGKNLDILSKEDVTVLVEGIHCNVTVLGEEQLVCIIPKEKDLPEAEKKEYTVIVKAGFLTFNLGKLKFFMPVKGKDIPSWVYAVVAAVAFILLVVIICLYCAYRRKKQQQSKSTKIHEIERGKFELRVARECREAFAELQTDMTDWSNDLSSSLIPFWDFRTYAMHVLFPGVTDHPVLKMKSNLSHNWESGLRKFAQLVYNKDFLLIYIKTIETQSSFNMKDRCNLASLLMVTLQNKMDYATEILKQLLCELIRKSVAQSHPKLLLRRTESVADKLLTNWLAFCMYNDLKKDLGKPLFMLFMAIKCQVEKGPVDACTGEARYSLSEDKLLRQTIEYETLKVTVSQEDESPIQVALLDCDTITQAKTKILDAFHKHEPYSSRPTPETFQLSWVMSDGTEKVILDDDASSVIDGPWRCLNTLAHYKIPNGALLKLSVHHTHFYGSAGSDLQSLPRTTFKPFSYTALSRGSREDLLEEGGRTWHLVKQLDYPTDKEDARHSKMLSEIYLTRLLATKGTLQKFVDGLFEAVFSMNRRSSTAPLPVKFLFDLLDEQAQTLNLADPEVLHTWKNNSLPLRFWINIIKNPNFVFDIFKPNIVDSCLSVIAQLFMDACSTSKNELGKDSPSNKLLYNRDIPSYKKRVENYYSNVQTQPSPSDDELKDFLADLSVQYNGMFNTDHALQELFRYVTKYQDQLQEKLEESGHRDLASNLKRIAAENRR